MLKKQTWRNIEIQSKGYMLYCDHYFDSNASDSIIYIQTPIGSVDSVFKIAYRHLELKGFNIFAIDLGGIGQSGGDVKNFGLASILTDLNNVVQYIKENYNDNIHLFGGTGIGGIIGQHYASQSNDLISFAQYGVGIFDDVSNLNYPKSLLKSIMGLLSFLSFFFPNLRIKSNPPTYHGYNKVADDAIYDKMLQMDPHIFKMNIHIVNVLFKLLLSKESCLMNYPKMPTLFFKTTHDRYFPKAYFDAYKTHLTCQNKMIIIDDVHNSHYIHAKIISDEVGNWFKENSDATIYERRKKKN